MQLSKETLPGVLLLVSMVFMSELAATENLANWKFQTFEVSNSLIVTNESIMDINMPFEWLTATNLDDQGNVYLHGRHKDDNHVVKLSRDLKLQWRIKIPVDTGYYRSRLEGNRLIITDKNTKIILATATGAIVSTAGYRGDRHEEFLRSDGKKIALVDIPDGIKIDDVSYISDIDADKVFFVEERGNRYWVLENYNKHFTTLFGGDTGESVYMVRLSIVDKFGKIQTQHELGQYESHFDLLKFGNNGRTYGPTIGVQLFKTSYSGGSDLYAEPLFSNGSFYVLVKSQFEGLMNVRHDLYRFDEQGREQWHIQVPYMSALYYQLFSKVEMVNFVVDDTLMLMNATSADSFTLINTHGQIVRTVTAVDGSLDSNYVIKLEQSDKRARFLRIDRAFIK